MKTFFTVVALAALEVANASMIADDFSRVDGNAAYKVGK